MYSAMATLYWLPVRSAILLATTNHPTFAAATRGYFRDSVINSVLTYNICYILEMRDSTIQRMRDSTTRRMRDLTIHRRRMRELATAQSGLLAKPSTLPPAGSRSVRGRAPFAAPAGDYCHHRSSDARSPELWKPNHD
jgi:hypothetical protein